MAYTSPLRLLNIIKHFTPIKACYFLACLAGRLRTCTLQYFLYPRSELRHAPICSSLEYRGLYEGKNLDLDYILFS